jgi:CheY-like chemotaxis protein
VLQVEQQSPLFVKVSAEHLLRALSNLVANAADAMSSPGTIVVRVLQRHLTHRLDGVDPVEPGHYAVIEVQDSGCGIPAALLPRILEPFFSNKAQTARGGTGLGLAIVHQVIKQSEGYVHVASQVGVGTTFALYLPLIDQSAVSSSAPPAVPSGGTEGILLVDDDHFQLRTARRILNQLGYRVMTAPSGEAALDIIEAASPREPIDLVVLDIHLSGELDGIGTLAQLRQKCAEQKALLVSGSARDQLHQLAADHDVSCLTKPYTAADLACAVRRALEPKAVE